MSKYIILVETGADVPEEMKKRYRIFTVPMHVSFLEETKEDGSFPIEDLFHFYKTTGVLPKTSGCNVGDFEKVLDHIHAEYPDHHILHLAYSAITTCSYQSCLLASEGRDYVTSIDTKQVTAGQCMVAVLTARYVEAHPEVALEELKQVVQGYIERIHMGFFPGDLDYLRAGGRVSNVAYLGAKILSLNPLIEIIDGKLVASKKIRGKVDKVALKLFPEFVEKYNLSREILYFPYSAGFPEESRRELEEKAKEMGFQEICWIQTGSVVSTHSGPGASGICGISAE